MILLAVLAVGCGASPEPPTSLATEALHNETVNGPFRLTLDLPAGTWRAGQPIVGQARLELVQGAARDLSGPGGGVIGFNYVEVGGRRHMNAEWDAACAPHQLAMDRPITESLAKSGGFSADDPDADFYRTFLSAPNVALPEGTWDISAATYFVDGAGCSGSLVQMQTTVRITVTP